MPSIRQSNWWANKMTTEKLPVKVMLMVIEATDPQPVPNKTYLKMSIKATTDRTGEAAYVFVTFYPSVMEVLKRSIGKTIECEVFLDEKKIVGIRDDKVLFDRELTGRAQTAVHAIADFSLSETVKVPEDILSDTFSVIKQWLGDAKK